MATIESTVLMSKKRSNGDLELMYPVTKKDNILDLEVATDSSDGIMSATDKAKLDGIAEGANKITVDGALSSSSTNPVQNKIINTALAGKAASNHSHTIDNVSGLQDALNSKAQSNHNQASSTITTMTGYSKPTTTSAISATDSLNTAIGKLEKALDSKQSSGSYAAASHKHTVSNISDLTATAAELNILDGITATTAELNYTEGVTSPIQTQLNAKAPIENPTFTGIPKAPTASARTNTTQIATTAFVQTAVSNGLAASDAMIIKGTIGTNGTVTALPTTYKTGWTYRVITPGTYAGQICEVGDLIIALVDRSGSGNVDSDWCVAQTNINGAITGVKSGDAYIDARESGSVATITHKDVSRSNTTSTAKPSQGGTFTAVKSVTSDAKGHITGVDTETVTIPAHNAFSNVKVGSTTIASDATTDTIEIAGSNVTLTPDATNDKLTIGITKSNVTSALSYTPLSGLKVGASATATANAAATNGNVYLNVLNDTSVQDSHNIVGSGATTVTSDANGKITISSTNTTYNPATQTANGLMASTDKTKLDLMSGSALTSNGTTATTTKGYTYGVAGVTTSPYTYAKWYVYLDSGITTLTNGMIIRMKIPVAGCNYGACVTIDGTNFHPVVYNTNYIFTTHMAVNSELMLMYDSGSSAKVWSNSTTSAAISGVWRMMNAWDYNSDTKVTQNNSTSNNNYRLLLSYSANDSNQTNISYKSKYFQANPSTGAFYANGYNRYEITGQTLDINTLTLSTGSPHMMHYINKTSGGATNITNIPLTGQPFILDVELVRWASTSDYVTTQTFRSLSDKYNIYTRWCTNGTWTSWTKYGSSVATSSANGLMSSTDKAKLDTISLIVKKDSSGIYIEA